METPEAPALGRGGWENSLLITALGLVVALVPAGCTEDEPYLWVRPPGGLGWLKHFSCSDGGAAFAVGSLDSPFKA